MAITILKIPELFSPSGNTLSFSFSSDNPDLAYFKVEVLEANSGGLIGIYNIIPTPDNPTSAFINLSKIIDSYVKYRFVEYDSNLIDVLTSPVIRYQLRITEVSIVYGLEVEGLQEVTEPRYAFDAELDVMSLRRWFSDDFAFPTSGSQISFLTQKPDRAEIFNDSQEGIYFLSSLTSGSLKAKYEFLNPTGVSLLTYTASIALTFPGQFFPIGKEYRLNLSPAKLATETGVDFDLVGSFKVGLIDGGGNEVSQVRTYKYKKRPCHLIPINIYWINQYGVLESYQFHNPEYSLDVTRHTLKKSPYSIIDNQIVNYEGNVFNTQNEILKVNPSLKVKVYTRDLSDVESKWLSRIVTSKQIYIQVSDMIIPVLLIDSSYSMMRRKFVSGLNIKEFTFQFPDNVTLNYIDEVEYSNDTRPSNIILLQNGDLMLLEFGGYFLVE